jgi:arylsulfatase A-like enzyme
MSIDEVTIADVLKDAGYATGICGKWHLGYAPGFNPVHQGFDRFRGFVSGNVDYHSHIDGVGYEDWWHDDQLTPEKGYATDLITDHAVAFIEENRERPFFLYVPHGAPHTPIQGRDSAPVRSPGQGGYPKSKDRELYAEMVEVMDEGIGKIIATLERFDLMDNTLVVFCSDNGGTSLSSNGVYRSGKGSLWEGGHRSPLIAHWPGRIEAGSSSDVTTMSMDFFPTFAALAGATVPDERKLDGVDFGSILLKGGELPDRDLFWKYGNAIAMRRGDWKYIEVKKEPHLYNLAEDPGEQRNLIDLEPDRTEQMAAVCERWYADVTKNAPSVSR